VYSARDADGHQLVTRRKVTLRARR
jgi:hypothetical protein